MEEDEVKEECGLHIWFYLQLKANKWAILFKDNGCNSSVYW